METKKKKLCDLSEIIMYFSYAVFVTRLILLVIVFHYLLSLVGY